MFVVCVLVSRRRGVAVDLTGMLVSGRRGVAVDLTGDMKSVGHSSLVCLQEEDANIY